MTYTVLLLYSVTREWLALSPGARETFDEKTLGPLLKKYEGRVQARLYDAEAFTARRSDFALFEAADLRDFYFLLGELRGTAFYTVPYIDVRNLIVGVEGGFRTYQAAQGAER